MGLIGKIGKVGKFGKVGSVSVLVATTIAVIGLGAGTASADARQVADGTDPIRTGCANDAFTAREARGALGGVDRVLVELRYSPRCKTAWARVTTLGIPDCVPGSDFCGQAIVHRDSDGREQHCAIPARAHGCYTAQLNDNRVTSYAFGWADVGAHTAYAQTGSYR
ncbi:DUF2690 domain-containing protein [Actinokineospora sp. NBRC 105648]|uniref:DUF2690 domain-containing protein n=1 Tax=Actinokineospora sp. NBRC 105648 TaxID=3032206 RepID=UPI0024A30111|nr:DUF2690 domain-containing protein [Actinokineospora sp. NBRC 105648]GLZ43137.1 hypothetical protein Acsp05_67610 [Actinokineospora sp. NBRC 105648]